MQKDQKIPESLSKQLNGYERALLRSESLLTFCAAFSFMILSFFIAFGSDRLWNTAPLVRVIIILSGITPLLYFIYKWGMHWIWKRRNIRDLAKKIQQHHRQLGDRLLGAIELADSEHCDENISEELQEAAIRKIAEQASTIDFRKDVDRKAPSRALAVAILLFSFVGILFYLMPDAFNNTLLRWANPLSSLARFTFTILGKMPEEKIVPASEPFNVECKIDSASRWKPEKLLYNLEGSEKGESNFDKNGKAIIDFPGVSKSSRLAVTAGDTGDSMQIKPVQRPSLKGLGVKIVFPEYIKRTSVEREIDGGVLSLLKGSTFTLKGKVNRDLISASITFSNGGSEKNIVVKSANFASSGMVADRQKKIKMNWVDTFNLSPAEPYELKIKVDEDRAPLVELPGLANFSAMLIDESLKVKIRAEDDYGVQFVDVEYYIDSIDGKKTMKRVNQTASLSAGSPTSVRLDSGFNFSPELMDIPEKSLVVLNGISNDFFPNRKPNRSVVHRIYILSHAQHAKLIQDRLDRIMAEVEDLIRRERESLSKNDKISKLDDKDIEKQQTTDKISDQKMREAGEKRELKKMITEGMQLLKEALRNRKFPDKTLSDWTKFMEQMKNMSNQEMKDIVANLRNAQNKQQRRKDIKKSMEAQRKMIAKLKKMLEKMDDSMKSLVVQNFVNRLRKEASNELKISGNMKKMIKDIVGLPIKDIPEKWKKEYTEQIKAQNTVNKNAREIRDELRAFFARTRIEKYQKVVDDMKKEKMDDALRLLKENLEINHTGASMVDSAKLAGNFNKWADMIGKSGKKQSGQSRGKGGKGGGEGKIDMEFLLAMLRMIQGEQNIRDKTRTLEQKINDKKFYKDKTGRVADQQNDLYRLLKSAQAKTKCPKVKQLLNDAGKAMKDAEEMLKKPQTDLETISAETEVIERLSGAFQKSCQNSKSQQGAQMMAMLKQMMMQQGGGKGGSKPGRGNGGFSNDPNKRFTGNDFKKQDPERSVDQTGGNTVVKLPEEYKSAIEAFYRKIEKE